MKLTVDEILGRVRKTEDELASYIRLATQWEKMYVLDPGFTKSWKEAIEQEGREVIVTPDPQNVVNLALRLVANKPKINVPPRSSDVKDIDTAKKVERWLQGMWWRLDVSNSRNLIRDAAWQAFVRGRHVFQVSWVEDVLPEALQKERLPFHVRTLEPMNVGIKRGPLYTEWAFHKYMADRVTIRNYYGDVALFDEKDMEEVEEFEVIDFYWTDAKTGKVWNAVILDGGTKIKRGKSVNRGDFLKAPKETIYPYIPIIEGYGDTAPVANSAYQGLSILHPMDGLWQYKCRLTSNMGTGVLWATWPFFMILEPEGHPLPRDIVVRPGATEVFPAGTDYKQVMPDFNLNSLKEVVQQIETSLQQATFPSVMYGETGGTTSGWQVNLLSDTARGRIFSALDSLERSVQAVNELCLALVEIMGGDDGVELYAFDKATNEAYTEVLKPKDIGKYYRNVVELRPSVPKDDVQRQTLGVRLYEAKLISGETMRDQFLDNIPPDEDTRVWTEQTLLDPELQPRAKLTHLIKSMPDTWEQFVKGTQFEQHAIAMGLIEAPPPPMGPPPGMGMPGSMPPLPPGGPSNEPLPPMPPGGMPPGGLPPPPPMQGGLPPGMPPMSPGGMPPGPMPPGAPPPGMMPPPGPLQEMMPPPVQPEAVLAPPMGGGIPPIQQGQVLPQDMGLPPDIDPLLFAQLQGQNIPPAEELEMIGGL
jgi:hypothetical protein